MEKFGFSGLWKHASSSILSAALLVADGVLSYLQVVDLPSWAHIVVVAVAGLLASYKGKAVPPVAPVE